jgi:hypothetical protein
VVDPVLGKLRHKDSKFKASLSYSETLSKKEKKLAREKHIQQMSTSLCHRSWGFKCQYCQKIFYFFKRCPK